MAGANGMIKPVYHGIEPQLVAQIHAALETLSPQEESILRMRFGIGEGVRCVNEVGQRFGMTQARVRQIETLALQKLRAAAVQRGPESLRARRDRVAVH